MNSIIYLCINLQKIMKLSIIAKNIHLFKSGKKIKSLVPYFLYIANSFVKLLTLTRKVLSLDRSSSTWIRKDSNMNSCSSFLSFLHHSQYFIFLMKCIITIEKDQNMFNYCHTSFHFMERWLYLRKTCTSLINISHTHSPLLQSIQHPDTTAFLAKVVIIGKWSECLVLCCYKMLKIEM